LGIVGDDGLVMTVGWERLVLALVLGETWNSSGVANEKVESSSSINGAGVMDFVTSSSLSSLGGNGEGALD
jgi:hypothetical protein